MNPLESLPSELALIPVSGVGPWWISSAAGASVEVRLLIGGVGTVLVLAGARVYRVGLLLSAFGLAVVGVLATVDRIAPWYAVSTSTAGGIAVAAGAIACAVVSFLHRWGLAALGGAAGAALAGVLGAQFLTESPWWLGVLGSVVGAIALPFVFPYFLRFVTPVVGAIFLAWACRWEQPVWWMVPIVVIGILVQSGWLRQAPGDAEATRDDT